MRLDASETGIFITQVTKAGHQQPFMGSRAGFVTFAARIPTRQGQGALLESHPLIQ